MRRAYIFLSIIVFLPFFLNAYDWPIKEDNVQHVLISVMGECRDDGNEPPVDSIDHFHRGIDINAPCSTKVYAIEGDTCYIDSAGRGINIGHFRYYHVVIRDYIKDTSFIAADSFFAKTDGNNHVHLQESDVELKHPGDRNDVHWLNPLREGGISPFNITESSAYPVIRDGSAGIKFWRQGTNDTISRDTMSGRIDISVDARTPWIDSLGRGYNGGATGNVGVYKAFGYIFAKNDTLRLDTLAKFEYQKYDTCPKNQNVDYAYAPGSYTSRHIYFITNNPFDTLNPQNYYWNTKQKINQPDSIDAESIEVAKFKDGFFWIKAHIYDIRNDSDCESVLVHIDNFNPRVKKTDPTPWFAFVPTRKHKIWCIFSEAMDRMQDISISGNQEEGYQTIGLSEVEIYLTFYIINQEEV
jgi:hypothetical protein